MILAFQSGGGEWIAGDVFDCFNPTRGNVSKVSAFG